MDRPRRHALVTGASSGLGRAIAVRLARDGWCIALADIDETGGQETLRQVQQAGGDGLVERLDVRHVEEWQALRDRLKDRWSTVDLLVNNAGVAAAGCVGEYSIDDWRWIVDVNLWNGIYGCHTFIDWLKANPRGAHIINTCSVASLLPAPAMAAYNVTKAGMLALSETLYAELKAHRVGVTALCPAMFQTNIMNGARLCRLEERQLFERELAKSKITADEIADMAVRAMHRKQLYVVAPFQARLFWYVKRVAPTQVLKAISRIYNKAMKPAGDNWAASRR